jgi:hypothetical protein
MTIVDGQRNFTLGDKGTKLKATFLKNHVCVSDCSGWTDMTVSGHER